MDTTTVFTRTTVLLIGFAWITTTASLLVAQQPADDHSGGLPREAGDQSASVPSPQELLQQARKEIYKTVDDVELAAYVFEPAGNVSRQRPAIVFFFGGGWRSGSPTQFAPHCHYLASRGMVAITSDYRVASRHGVVAKDCVADAKSAIRWVRKNAERLGVDPQRIVAAGGSAGGHLAACTAIIDGFDAPQDDLSISCKPNALALFNPALVLAPIDGQIPIDAERYKQLHQRMGVPPEQLSPYHHLTSDVPPIVIFHGEADTTVPFKTVELFAEKVRQLGGQCTVYSYPEATHGFFNYNRDHGRAYRETLQQLDRFLQELGYLKPAW